MRRVGGRVRIFSTGLAALTALAMSAGASAAGWQRLDLADDPGERSGHAMASMGERFVMFGGEDANADLFNDLYVFEEGAWAGVDAQGTVEALVGASTVVTSQGAIVLFGGRTEEGAFSNAVFTFESGQWAEASPANDAPPERAWHSAVVTDDDVMYVVGGEDEDGLMEDLWSYDVDTREWTEETAFYYGVLRPAFAVFGDRLFLLSACFENLFKMDLASRGEWEIIKVTDPPPRRELTAVVQTEDGAWFMGGSWEGEVHGDLWWFDAASETYTRLEDPPVGVHEHAGALAEIDGTGALPFFYGGVTADGETVGGGQIWWPNGEAPDDIIEADDNDDTDDADGEGDSENASQESPGGDSGSCSSMVISAGKLRGTIVSTLLILFS